MTKVEAMKIAKRARRKANLERRRAEWAERMMMSAATVKDESGRKALEGKG